MVKGEVLKRIQDLMIDVLDLDDLHINEQTTARDVEGWDSLSHLRLITEIEAEFSVTFTTGEIERFKNIGDMISTIESKSRDR